MTAWLIKHFVRDYRDTSDPAVRTAYGQFAGIVGIVCNILLCLAKGFVGLAAGSVSIVADAVNNLSDAASNIVSFLGFKLASRPPDRMHPYGHGRFEYLAGLVVAVLVSAVGLELAHAGFDRILAPEPTELTGASLVVMMLSIAVKGWMMGFDQEVGGRIGSEAIEATAVDSRNDVVATTAVLVCAVISQMTGYSLDGWVSLALGAFVLVGGLRLVFDAVNPLLGEAPDPALVQRIDDAILSRDEVIGTHDLMVHDYGPGRQFASAHVAMPAELDPMRAHRVINDIEQQVLDDEGIVLTIHWDPVPKGAGRDARGRDFVGWADELARLVDSRLRVKSAVELPEGEGLELRVVRPGACGLADDEIERRLAELAHRRFPDTHLDITISDED